MKKVLFYKIYDTFYYRLCKFFTTSIREEKKIIARVNMSRPLSERPTQLRVTLFAVETVSHQGDSFCTCLIDFG